MPTTGGLAVTLAGVAGWVGRNRDLVPGESVPRRGCGRWRTIPRREPARLNFSRAYSHLMIAGGIELLPHEQVFPDAVLQAGGSET
jgi:hypothetical protein